MREHLQSGLKGALRFSLQDEHCAVGAGPHGRGYAAAVFSPLSADENIRNGRLVTGDAAHYVPEGHAGAHDGAVPVSGVTSVRHRGCDIDELHGIPEPWDKPVFDALDDNIGVALFVVSLGGPPVEVIPGFPIVE